MTSRTLWSSQLVMKCSCSNGLVVPLFPNRELSLVVFSAIGTHRVDLRLSLSVCLWGSAVKRVSGRALCPSLVVAQDQSAEHRVPQVPGTVRVTGLP